MRGAFTAVVALAIAGCADPGDFYLQRVYITNPRTSQIQVHGPGYEMTFQQRDTRLPESLRIASAVEALDGTAQCPQESLAGIAVFPATHVAGNVTDDAISSSIEVVESGAGVVSVAVTYEVPYSCMGAQSVRGTTTYTFYSSNRIVRHDRVSATMNDLVGTTGCACNGGTANMWFFTSYWAFNTPRLVDRAAVPFTDGRAARETCAQVGNHLIAHAWSEGRTRTALANHNATVYDFDTDGTLNADTYEVTSAIQIGFGDDDRNIPVPESKCNELHQGLIDVPLTVDGTRIETNEHGFYVDPNVHTGGTFELLADDGDIPPFGVVLDIGSSRHVRVARSEGSYSVQPASGGGYLIWFDDGLADNTSIAITPY
jgi:hypothetical protein